MKATDTGIQWDRLLADDYEIVSNYVVDASARYCAGSLPTSSTSLTYNPDHSKTHHFTTRGGEERCTVNALQALTSASMPYGSTRMVFEALSRAVGNTRKAVWAEHVKEA